MRIEPWGLITLAIARGRAVAVIKVIAAAAMLQIEAPRGCSDDGPPWLNEDVQGPRLRCPRPDVQLFAVETPR
jgi:hypothetical protein